MYGAIFFEDSLTKSGNSIFAEVPFNPIVSTISCPPVNGFLIKSISVLPKLAVTDGRIKMLLPIFTWTIIPKSNAGAVFERTSS